MWKSPQVDFVELECERLPRAFDGMSVLHMTDMHVTRWTRGLSLWEKRLQELRPDVLAVTGDLGHRSWLWKKSLPNVGRLLDAVSPKLGAYFILGNHDSVKLGPALEREGRQLLENETVFLKRGDDRVALIGVHQHRRIDTDIPAAMREVTPADFKLMLLHYPDLIYPAMSAGADVCLAGHTHGGQICWPDGRPMMRHDVLPHGMCTGVHKLNGTWMVVNRGIGAAGIRVRMFCPPQVMMLTLRRKGTGEVPKFQR